MASITLKGNAVNTIGTLPATGTVAPDFILTKTDLSETSLKEFAGKKVILNIFPSLDTSVCATSVRKFNADAQKLENTVVLCISKDLPFAHSRFCSTEGLDKVVSLSELRDENFGKSYGVKIIDGPLAGNKLGKRETLLGVFRGRHIHTRAAVKFDVIPLSPADEFGHRAALETRVDSEV